MTINHLSAWMKQSHVNVPSFLLSHYKDMGLTEEEFVLLLHIQNYSQNGNEFPTPSELAAVMSGSETECTILLRNLVQHGFLAIVEGEQPGYECYSLEPLYEKMAYEFLKGAKQAEFQEKATKSETLYSVFEQEFGRPLSPFEGETLTMWHDEDKHSPELIKAALKEAVISGKLSFRYIDRILFDWQKHGIQTTEQARNHGEKFRSLQKKNDVKTKSVPEPKNLPLYNWLER